MPQVDEFVSVSEAKNKLLDLIRRMKHKQEVVAITRDGVPSAVLLSMDRFDGLMETIEILSDQKAMRTLRRSLKQAEKGQGCLTRWSLAARLRETVSCSLYQGGR